MEISIILDTNCDKKRGCSRSLISLVYMPKLHLIRNEVVDNAPVVSTEVIFFWYLIFFQYERSDKRGVPRVSFGVPAYTGNFSTLTPRIFVHDKGYFFLFCCHLSPFALINVCVSLYREIPAKNKNMVISHFDRQLWCPTQSLHCETL